MIIRRSFNFCAAHVVRNCTSKRCSSSLHGHNYLVELFVSADRLDDAGMILDFGIFKNEIADFIDAFDHGYHFWNRESQELQDFIKAHSQRYVSLSHNPSAENYALLFLYFIDKLLGAMEFGNHEGNLRVESVRVHETNHGYAEAFYADLSQPAFSQGLSLDSLEFSPAIMEGWKDRLFLQKLKDFYANPKQKPFIYPQPPHQIPC